MSILMSLFNRLLGRRRKPRPLVREVARERHVLSQEQYKELERKLPGPGLTHGDSGEHYAFNLGVQHALRVLREGFVIDVPGNERQD